MRLLSLLLSLMLSGLGWAQQCVLCGGIGPIANNTCATGDICSPGFNGTYPVCVRCAPGMFCPPGASLVDESVGEKSLLDFLCPPGKFCENGRIYSCPQGNFCPLGSSKPISCDTFGGGIFCGEEFQEPERCPKGYFCPSAKEMIVCPEGSFCSSGEPPRECPILSECKEGSVEPTVSASGFFVILLALFLTWMIILWVRHRAHRKKSAWAAHLRLREARFAMLRMLFTKEGGIGDHRRTIVNDMVLAGFTLGRQTTDIRFTIDKLTVGMKKRGILSNLLRKKEEKEGHIVLDGVEGHFAAGRLIAVMGPSGSGKTSVLNVLTGSASSYGVVDAVITMKEEDKQPQIMDPHKLRPLIGYVPQDDIVFPRLTVRENLTYSALLRLPKSVSLAKAARIVDDALILLGLTDIADEYVGSVEQRGISGGQRKRVNVGLELVADPHVILLDEPTSGLDSTAAKELVTALQRLRKLGKTIAAVIHQPRYSMFCQFDELLLLAKGGKVVYSGPTVDCLQYFAQLGFQCDPFDNPADFIMDVVSGDIPRKDHPEFVPADLVELWKSRGLHVLEDIQQAPTPGTPGVGRESGTWNRPHDVDEVVLDIAEHGKEDEEKELQPERRGKRGDAIQHHVRVLGKRETIEIILEQEYPREWVKRFQRACGAKGGVVRASLIRNMMLQDGIRCDLPLATALLKAMDISKTGNVNVQDWCEFGLAFEELSQQRAHDQPFSKSTTALVLKFLDGRTEEKGEHSRRRPPVSPFLRTVSHARKRTLSQSDQRPGFEGDVEEIIQIGEGPYAEIRDPQSFWIQLWLCTSRSMHQLFRRPKILLGDFFLSVIAAIGVGLVFGPDQNPQTQGFQGMMSGLALGMVMAVGYTRVFGSERLTFARESASGLNTLSYFLAKNIVYLIDGVLRPIVFATVLYSFLAPRASMGKFIGVMLLVGWASSGIGLLISWIVSPSNAIVASVTVSLLFGAVLCGVYPSLAALRDRNPFMAFLTGFSFNRWGVEALVVSSLENLPDYVDSAPYYKTLGYVEGSYGTCLGVLFLIGFGLRVVSYFIMVYKQ